VKKNVLIQSILIGAGILLLSNIASGSEEHHHDKAGGAENHGIMESFLIKSQKI
jgi:hypothetical protein